MLLRPQAKFFTGCLVLGPLILLSQEDVNPGLDITARVFRADGTGVFEKSTNTSRINAPLSSLIDWARTHLVITPGEIFSTGTGMVPEGEARVIESGMQVEIECPAIGLLRHGAGVVPEGGLTEAAALNPDYDRWEFEQFDGRQFTPSS